VVVKGAATSGATVATGTTALVAWNGSDFVLVSQALANATGTLPVSKGGTGATSLTANNVLLGNGTSAPLVVAPGTSGNLLTSNGTTWTSAAPAPGGIDYVYKTANYTTTNNEGVLADTSGGAFTVTLPATPSTGDQVVVADAGDSFGTNNLTVGRNGSTIGGLAENLVIDITGVSVQFVYDGTTWNVYAQIGGAVGNAVTLDGVQTLTNKTLDLSNNTLITTSSELASAVTDETGTGALVFATTPVLVGSRVTVSALGTLTTGTTTLDLATAQVYTATITASDTITIAFSNEPSSGQSQVVLLRLIDAGGGTIVWPANTKFTAGAAPTLTASGVDVLGVYYDVTTTTYMVFVIGLDVKVP
jgi:hypothetical protein